MLPNCDPPQKLGQARPSRETGWRNDREKRRGPSKCNPQRGTARVSVDLARLWQFETWLRAMIYVELRARYGDSWVSYLKSRHSVAYTKDKQLTHMPTREDLPTSYMQLGDLLQTMSSEWSLFEPYLPPQQIWDAKLLEVSQIRRKRCADPTFLLVSQ